ncbi:hypothetical protein Tco_0328841 [Tanacetum coccineum]
MDTEKALLEDLDGDDVDVHIYRSMIRSLMYLTSSRLDIMFAVCAYARFQVTPKVSHLHAIKRIFRCLKGQPKLGLWYPRDSSFDLVAYSDSVYAGASLDRKSTTGGCQFLGIVLKEKLGYTGENIPLFPAMIVQGLVIQGEGSTHPVESHHIPTSAPSTLQLLVSPTSRRLTRQEYMVPQPISPTQTLIAYEAASTSVDVKYGGVTTTVTGLEAGQGSELMVFCTSLSKKVESLETDLKQTKQIYGAACTKLIKKMKKVGENREEDSSVTTASVAVSTASPTRNTRDSTANDITMAETMVYIRKSAAKYKAAVRLLAELKEEERQRIAKVHESASSFNVEEWEDIQARVEADEELVQRKRGTLTLMLVAKFLVDQDNEMSRELLRKIFMHAERLRR